MRRDANIIGPQLVKLRYQRGWTQDELVAKLQIAGCDITRDVLANLETRRSPATDRQIDAFCVVFRIGPQELFPARLGTSLRQRRYVGLLTPLPTRGRDPKDPFPLDN